MRSPHCQSEAQLNICSKWHAPAAGRVSPAELGANMGTSLPMIDRHYYHFDPKKGADRL